MQTTRDLGIYLAELGTKRTYLTKHSIFFFFFFCVVRFVCLFVMLILLFMQWLNCILQSKRGHYKFSSFDASMPSYRMSQSNGSATPTCVYICKRAAAESERGRGGGGGEGARRGGGGGGVSLPPERAACFLLTVLSASFTPRVLYAFTPSANCDNAEHTHSYEAMVYL